MLTHAQVIDPSAFHAWWTTAEVTTGNVESVCRDIDGLQTAEAALRCSMLARDCARWDLVDHYLLQADLRPGPEDVRIGVLIQGCFRELALSRVEGRVSSLDGPANVLGALLSARERLDGLTSRRLFTLEQQYHCSIALSNVFHKRREWDEAAKFVSQAIIVAKNLNVPRLISYGRTLIIIYLTHEGKIEEAEQRNQELLKSDSGSVQLDYNESVSAEIRFRFGCFAEARTIIESSRLESASKQNVFDFFDLMLGRLDPDRSPSGQAKFAAIRQGVRELISINGICPISSNDTHISRLAGDIFELFPKDEEFPGSVERAVSVFLKAKSRLLLRQYALAAVIAETFKSMDANPDVFAALVAALKIEICLHVHDIQNVSIGHCLHDFRLIAESFDRYSFSSSVGLAQFIRYWTPLTAAFLAVLPDANTHFGAASQAILKIESAGAFAHTLQIPNKYASEQVFASHGISLRRNSITVPNLNAREQSQRDALKVMNGAAPHWRPVLSIGPITYGLMRLARETGNDEYARHARALFQQFGLFPKSKTDFAEHLQNAVVDAYNRLFNRFTTVEGFVDEIVRLRL